MFLWKQLWLFGLLSETNMTTLMCGWSKLRWKKSNWYGCLLLSKIENIQKPCLYLKSGFYSLVFWFLNLTLTDKHGTKIYKGSSGKYLALWEDFLRRTSACLECKLSTKWYFYWARTQKLYHIVRNTTDNLTLYRPSLCGWCKVFCFWEYQSLIIPFKL